MLNYIFISILGIALAIWLQFLMRWVIRLLIRGAADSTQKESSKKITSEDAVMLVYKDTEVSGPVIKNDTKSNKLEKAI